MLRPSLTSRGRKVRGRLVHDYDYKGSSVAVFDSARNMLLVIELFQDESLTPYEKANILAQMLFADPAQVPQDPFEFGDMITAILWDACGLDLKGEHEHEAPVFDYEQDASRIKASLLMAYGINADESLSEISYAELCDLLRMLMETGSTTPFREAVYYRTAKRPRATKYNADELRRFDEMRRHYRLRPKGEPSAQSMAMNNRQSSALFERLWREANGE